MADLTRLTYQNLDRPGIVHGIAVFKDASHRVGYEKWRSLASERLARSLPVPPKRIAIPRQVHSSTVLDIDGIRDDEVLLGDGLVSADPGTLIGVSVSDCIPLFAADTKRRVIGLAHCGWRGIAGGVVEELVSALASRDGGHETATYLIGASIGPCCYEVGDDVLGCFEPEEVTTHSRASGEAVYLDLKSVVAGRLEAFGVAPSSISIDSTCTSCREDVLTSYRAQGRLCGRMLAFLMLTP
jgi:hypothetical protein